MLTIELLDTAGLTWALVQHLLDQSLQQPHIVNASRYARIITITYPVYHFNACCVEWDKLVNC